MDTESRVEKFHRVLEEQEQPNAIVNYGLLVAVMFLAGVGLGSILFVFFD